MQRSPTEHENGNADGNVGDDDRGRYSDTLVSIQFPGFLSDARNPTNALFALGGLDAVQATVAAVHRLNNVADELISKSRGPTSRPADVSDAAVGSTSGSDEGKAKIPALTLNLRPGDVSSTSNIESSPPHAEKRMFALRIFETSSSNCDQRYVANRVVVLGRVTHTIPFLGIADWQFLGNRTLSAASKSISSGSCDVGGYADAPHRSLHVRGGSNEVSSASATWRPVLAQDARTVRAMQVVEYVRANRAATCPALVKSTTSSSGTQATASSQVVDMMELCRPWRFSRTGVELAQTDYFFRQQVFDRCSTFTSPFQLGKDRRSDVDRLGSKPWKAAADVDQVPQHPPSPATLRERDGKGQPVVQRQVQARKDLVVALQQAFAERPVWLRRPVLQRVSESVARASFPYTIRLVGYSFYGPGPFLQAWIRYGYDPRAHREARKWQVVEVRLKHPVVLEAVKLQYARVMGGLPESERRQVWPSDFTLRQVPTNRHVFVQLSDVDIPETQTLLEQEEYPDTFDSKWGFFTKDGLNRVVKSIRKHILCQAVELVGEARAKQIVTEFQRTGRYRKRKAAALSEELQANLQVPIPVHASQVHRAVAHINTRALTSVPQVSPQPDVEVQAGSEQVATHETESNDMIVGFEPIRQVDHDEMAEINFDDVEGFEVIESDDDGNGGMDDFLDDCDEDVDDWHP